jgi:hypothetical protein
MTLTQRRPASGDLGGFYTLVNPAAIDAFLESHPAAVVLLRDAREAIPEFFPAGRFGRVLLELIPSPYPDDPDELLVEIETDLEVGPSLDTLSRFSAGWLLPRSATERRDVVFNVGGDGTLPDRDA